MQTHNSWMANVNIMTFLVLYLTPLCALVMNAEYSLNTTLTIILFFPNINIFGWQVGITFQAKIVAYESNL